MSKKSPTKQLKRKSAAKMHEIVSREARIEFII